ncbi:kinase-like protein [Artomyces pyxidatus]|uniref:Kinase-like protein n=1 Tax=Artomyces pyxidatus TaxID=48021 RepID=A0ACB8T560_9AGAM|nr:kinase-like protein [Artomyces pyxidatus]
MFQILVLNPTRLTLKAFQQVVLLNPGRLLQKAIEPVYDVLDEPASQNTMVSQVSADSFVDDMQDAIHDPVFLGIWRDAQIVWDTCFQFCVYQCRLELKIHAIQDVRAHERLLVSLAVMLSRKVVYEGCAAGAQVPLIVVEAAPVLSLLAPPLSPVSPSPTSSSSPTTTSPLTAYTGVIFLSSATSVSSDQSTVSFIPKETAVVQNAISPPVRVPPPVLDLWSESLISIPAVSPCRRVAVPVLSTDIESNTPLVHLAPPGLPPPVAGVPAPLPPSYPRKVTVDDLEPVKVLGKGAFGTVYLAKERLTGLDLAVKVIPKARFAAKGHSGYFGMLLSEQEAMRGLDGRKGYLPLHASWHDTDNFYLATEYCPQGDLMSEIRKWSRIPPTHARFWTAQLLLALEGMHKLGLVHRDIKPDNLLFDRDGNLVIADFGLARDFSLPGGQSQTTLLPPGLHQLDEGAPAGFTVHACGTPPFMAPEALMHQPYSYGADYWAMGVTLFTMLTGRHPFGDPRDPQGLKAAVLSKPVSFEQWDKVEPAAQDFLRMVLAKDPADRPTIAQMKTHPFFESIDWSLMAAHKVRSPWVPIAFPLRGTCGLIIPAGTPYLPAEDPFPEYTFVSRTLYEPPPPPYVEATAEFKPEPHQPQPKFGSFRKFFSRAFKRGGQAKAAVPSQAGSLQRVHARGGSIVFHMECPNPSPLSPPGVAFSNARRVPPPSLQPTAVNDDEGFFEGLPTKSLKPPFTVKVKSWMCRMLGA